MVERQEGRVLLVYGVKGGVGTTQIAVNLSLALAKETRQKVVLLDLDRQGKDEIAHLLNIPIKNTSAQLVPLLDKLSSMLLEGYLTHYRNIGCLPLVSKLEDAQAVAPEHFQTILKLLQETYSFIVIDAQSSFTSLFFTALDMASMVLFVLTPETSSLYQVKKTLKVMGELNFPLGAIRLVLNRADIRDGLKPAQITEALGKEIFATLPEDDLIIRSMNTEKVLADFARSPFIQAVGRLASALGKEKMKAAGDLVRSGIPMTKGKFVADDFSGGRTPAVRTSLRGEGTVKKDSPQMAKRISLKLAIHERLIKRIDLKKVSIGAIEDPVHNEKLRAEVGRAVGSILSEVKGLDYTGADYKQLTEEIIDEALGLGPIEDLIKDPQITEIMVNKCDQIYVEKAGKLILTNKRFLNNQQIIDIARRIVAPLGRRVDESSPLVDARLKDGSRVNVVIPPIALQGPMITIRRFPEKIFTAEELIAFGSISSEMVEFLRIAIKARKSIIVNGGTGSGKTTMLNILSRFIPEGERIVTIEDTAELRLDQEHIGRLEARPPNIEGKGAIPIRTLVGNALRMRPDRIVVGECRGGEALDMLQAMNTGHEGSITTIHSNTPRDLIIRLETMVMMSGMELPVKVIRTQIASAVDIVVQVSRMSDGTRKVVQITEITGMEGDVITMQDIFKFKQTGLGEGGKVLGYFEPTGVVPTFSDELEAKGMGFPMKIFQKKVTAPPQS